VKKTKRPNVLARTMQEDPEWLVFSFAGLVGLIALLATAAYGWYLLVKLLSHA
jgi:hypothetical protein